MILFLKATLSKPNADKVLAEFGKPYEKVKLTLESPSTKSSGAKNSDTKTKSVENKTYFVEFFTKTQAFQKHFSQKEAQSFIEKHAGITFKNCVISDEDNETTMMASRKGKINTVKRALKAEEKGKQKILLGNIGKENSKNYILKEGNPIPFLVETGIMTKEGKVINSKYDKFRQINRYLEFVRDILDDITQVESGIKKRTTPIKIVDFGCGKSYLTFAVYHYLNQILNLPIEIIGLDLKKDVIENCNLLAKKCNYTELKFFCGSIEDYFAKTTQQVDLVMTLHACDTATDYALASAVKQNAKAILSVPCCQHEMNKSVTKSLDEGVNALLKYGIIRERFCALATDAMRCELLKQCGYSVQLLEFIDMEGTPKNLLIRGVKRNQNVLESDYSKISELLGCDITLAKLLKEQNYDGCRESKKSD